MKVTKNNKVTKNAFVTKKKTKGSIRYEEYLFTPKELIVNLLLGCAGIAVVARMFYDSVIAFVLLLPFTYVWLLLRRDALCKARKMQLEREFRDVIMAVSANIAAGYSVENAFCESYRDIHMLYGSGSVMADELDLMMRRLRNNEQLEDILMQLGERSGVRDIQDFAQVFRIAKRNGGSLAAVIDNTARIIGGKAEVRREINTIMSEKRMEQSIMQMMPFFMMAYLSVTNKGFFDVLYHNALGVLVMTGCFVVYLAAGYLGARILEIEV